MTASQKPVFAFSTTTIAPPLGRPSLGFSKNPEATFTARWSSPRTQALLMSTSPRCSATSMCMTGGISTLPSESHVNASSIARRHCASYPTQARSSDSVNTSTGIRFSPFGGAREARSGSILLESGSVDDAGVDVHRSRPGSADTVWRLLPTRRWAIGDGSRDFSRAALRSVSTGSHGAAVQTGARVNLPLSCAMTRRAALPAP